MELNLGSPKKPKWISVRLLFVLALNEDGNGGAKDWALILTSDDTLSADRILEIYALRLAIEVYFKEAKQHLGYLKQQTRIFASHLASVHLSAVRYLMLVHISQQQGENLSEVRTKMQKQLHMLSYAQQFWNLFRSFVHTVLRQPQHQLGEAAETIFNHIDKTIHKFIIKSLQLDEMTLELEHQSKAFLE